MAGTEEKTDDGQKIDDQVTNEGQEEMVSMERFNEIQTELAASKEKNTIMTNQAAVINANQKPVEPQKEFNIYEHVGLDPEDPDDVPNQAQLKQIDEYNQKRTTVQLDQMQFLSTHPDYNDIVGTDDDVRAGKYAEPLAKAIKANPALTQLILNSPNRREAAYQIAKSYIETPIEKVETDEAKNAIDEAVKIANKVKSSSNASGGGDGLSSAGRFESMSDADFLALATSNGATI